MSVLITILKDGEHMSCGMSSTKEPISKETIAEMIAYFTKRENERSASSARSTRKRDVKKGEVYIDLLGKKTVSPRDNTFHYAVQVVADRPHGDDDFSYICGSEHCRCIS